jgi:hypothetical protein
MVLEWNREEWHGPATITISDEAGQVTGSYTVAAETGKFTLPSAAHSAGVCFITLRVGEKSATRKVVMR